MQIINMILTHIRTTVTESFKVSLALAILFMFFYLLAREHGWKASIKQWGSALLKDQTFHRTFLLALYVAMVLYRTILGRRIWENPLSNVMGGWGLYDGKGNLTTESIENVLLFVPFTALLFWAFGERIIKRGVWRTILWNSFKVSFLFSLFIETFQLVFRLGTFQLSDLFYNTLGGVLGGVIYGVLRLITKACSRKNTLCM